MHPWQVLKLHPEWAPRGVKRFVSMLRWRTWWLSCMPCITRSHHMHFEYPPDQRSCYSSFVAVSGWVTLRDLACIMFKRTGSLDLAQGFFKSSSSCRTEFFLDCQQNQRLSSWFKLQAAQCLWHFCNLISCQSLTFCARHLRLSKYPVLTLDAARSEYHRSLEKRRGLHKHLALMRYGHVEASRGFQADLESWNTAFSRNAVADYTDWVSVKVLWVEQFQHWPQ